ncbi:MAG: FHA domain-containing protein [Planctomyces sp.]|nr:FHA domain-containing protein [Planctomyces sp.]
MLAHLVPCSGGKPIALTRPHLFLGRRVGTDAAAPLSKDTARCRLRLTDGWWVIESLDPAEPLRINNRACPGGRLRPGDELGIGRARYRIEYAVPMDAATDVAMQVLSAPIPGADVARGEPSGASPKSGSSSPPPAPPSRLAPAVPSRQSLPARPVSPPAPSGPRAHLVPIGGGVDFLITSPVATIGRDKTCDVTLRVKTVSSVHCRLEWIDGYWRVFDMDSRNGVRVDSQPCREAWVFPESRLSIADQRFQLDYVPVGARPLPETNAMDRKESLMSKIGMKDQDLNSLLERIQDQYGPDDSENKRRDLTLDM